MKTHKDGTSTVKVEAKCGRRLGPCEGAEGLCVAAAPGSGSASVGRKCEGREVHFPGPVSLLWLNRCTWPDTRYSY